MYYKEGQALIFNEGKVEQNGGMGIGDGIFCLRKFSKSNWREDKKDMFFAFQIEMLYNRFLFQSEILYFLLCHGGFSYCQRLICCRKHQKKGKNPSFLPSVRL